MTLDDFPNIVSATSKTEDGNMSFLKGAPEEALKNREKFLSRSGINIGSIVCPNLQLSDGVAIVTEKDLGKNAIKIDYNLKADSLITDVPGITLFLLTADCMPISVYDRQKNVIALIHSGWQGLDLGIIKKTINKMAKDFGTYPKDLLVKIGPSIGPCCYTSNPDVVKQKDDPKWKGFVIPKDDGKLALDIWSMAEKQLKDVGVSVEKLENKHLCTYHTDLYFSHRKSNDKNQKDFRFATVLGINKNE